MSPTIENAVINNVLCFIKSSRNALTELNISAMCQSFFSADTVSTAKTLLFQFVDESPANRKGVNKLKSDVSDMLGLLKKIDDNQIPVPLFLCDGYAKMPPAAGFEVLAEHVVNVVSEIADVKEEVSKIKQTETTIEQTRELREIKDELGDVKLMLRNIASARSNPATTYSGVVLGNGLPGSQMNSRNSSGYELPGTMNTRSAGNLYSHTRRGAARGSSASFPTRGNRSRSFEASRSSVRRIFSTSGRNSTGETSVERNLSTGGGSALENEEGQSSEVHESSTVAMSSSMQRTDDTDAVPAPEDDVENAAEQVETPTDDEESWTTVNRRRNARKVIKGSKKFNGSLIAASEYRDIYIGRCHVSVTSEIIEDYAKNEIGIEVLGCSCISRDGVNIKAFRLSVRSEDSEKILDASLWPENVYVRKFVRKVFNSYNSFNGPRH